MKCAFERSSLDSLQCIAPSGVSTSFDTGQCSKRDVFNTFNVESGVIIQKKRVGVKAANRGTCARQVDHLHKGNARKTAWLSLEATCRMLAATTTM